MIRALSQKSRLFLFLHEIELDLYRQTKEAGCPYCESEGRVGQLDDAFYERNPRGGPEELPEELRVRRSLCCAEEGCRKRTLPPSCLFMGRRVYWKIVILAVLVCRQRRDGSASYRKLTALLGVSRSTVWRWMTYFEERFPEKRCWEERRPYLGVEIDEEALPHALWEIYVHHYDDWREALLRMTQFLSVPPGEFLMDEHLTQKTVSFREF